MNDEILNAIVDTPDERDIPYRDLVLVGGSTADKVVFPMDRLIIQNQAAQDITSMACSRYGATHIINGQTLLTEDKQDLQGIDLWKRYLEKNPSAERNGATLLSALDQAKKEGLISAYGTIDTVELAIEAIDKGHFIYTGSNNGDWISVRDKNLYALRTDSQIIGHCWVIVNHKKDEKKLIAINSLGQENGYFEVPFELFSSLFTKYAILPKAEISPVLLYKKQLMENITIEAAKTALTNSFWNGERPQDPVTREEAAAMVERVFEKLSK